MLQLKVRLLVLASSRSWGSLLDFLEDPIAVSRDLGVNTRCTRLGASVSVRHDSNDSVAVGARVTPDDWATRVSLASVLLGGVGAELTFGDSCVDLGAGRSGLNIEVDLLEDIGLGSVRVECSPSNNADLLSNNVEVSLGETGGSDGLSEGDFAGEDQQSNVVFSVSPPVVLLVGDELGHIDDGSSALGLGADFMLSQDDRQGLVAFRFAVRGSENVTLSDDGSCAEDEVGPSPVDNTGDQGVLVHQSLTSSNNPSAILVGVPTGTVGLNFATTLTPLRGVLSNDEGCAQKEYCYHCLHLDDNPNVRSPHFYTRICR
uniref:Uncharacterized protein n=1 Tax=Lygus hesperus TaxID=30085 RepID=A0A146M3M2_LYGHE